MPRTSASAPPQRMNVSATFMTQENIAPGAVKQRHLVASPTQVGDMYYGGGNSFLNLPIGTDGQVLTSQNGIPEWGLASASGVTDALKSLTTTINVSLATAPTSGQVLTATSSIAAHWATPSTVATALQTSTTNVSVFGATAPSSGQVLTATSGSAADWESPVVSISAGSLKTTGADVTVSGAAAPSASQVLTATSSTNATWQTPSVGSGSINYYALFPAQLKNGSQTFSTAFYVSWFVLPAAMTVNSLRLYFDTVAGSPKQVEMGLYDSGRNLLGSGSVTPTATTPGYYTVALSPGLALTAGTTYGFGICHSTSGDVTTTFIEVANLTNIVFGQSFDPQNGLPSSFAASGATNRYIPGELLT